MAPRFLIQGDAFASTFDAKDTAAALHHPTAETAPAASELLDERDHVVAMKSGALGAWVLAERDQGSEPPRAA